MDRIVLHPVTKTKLQNFIDHPSHALLIVGPRGMGKGSVAQQIAANLLTVQPHQLASHAYLRHITVGKEQSIAIDTVRELEHFLSLRVPGKSNRIIIIEDAHTLTNEAQNALLKTLEEPPERTTIILTATGERNLLPTIRSRAAVLLVQRPAPETLQTHFADLGHTSSAIQKAYLMSGGLPGLMTALLATDEEHPLVIAATTAREIIQKSTFDRLAMIDQLAKQKQYCLDVLAIMQQMSHLTLAGSKPTKSWQNILAQSFQASQHLQASAQPKLVLTNLMLNL